MRIDSAVTKTKARFYPFMAILALGLILGSGPLLSSGALAAQATAKWNAQSDAAGYKLYYGTTKGSYSSSVNAGTANTYTVSNLAAGTTYYFALTAYNSAGAESGYSSEASYKTPCTYSISPASANVAAAGGTGSVAVTTQSGCTWSVANSTPWITITSGSSGTGSGTVGYSVAANTATGSRSAAMTVASNTFSVTQSGSSGTTTYTITASAGAGGSISPTGATVNRGTSQTFTISPASGYKISNVTVDGTSVGAVSTYTFSNVTANHTISAAFTSTTTATYTISATVTAGGSISPQGATVAKGASQTFTISPSTGYRINNVTVDGASMGAISTYTFSNVTANHSISASFTATTTTTAALSSLTISPAVVKGGTVATGTVTLNAPAPAGGAVVSLSSSALSLWPDLIPRSITIPAGSTRASFSVKTHTPYGEGYVIFTANYRGVTKQFNLYVLK